MLNLLKKTNNTKWTVVQVFSWEEEGQMANRPNRSPGKAENCWWKWQWWKSRWWKSSASEDRLSSMSRWDIGHLLAGMEDTLSATISQVMWMRSCPHCAQSKQGMSLWCLHDLWSCEESSGCHELQMQHGAHAPNLGHWELDCLLNSFSLNCHFGKSGNK